MDISRVFAEINVSISQISKYEINKEISVFIPLLNKKYPGKITAVFPEIDSATGTVKIRILIDNPDNKINAFEKGLEWGDKIPFGIFYKQNKPALEDNLPQISEKPLVKQDIMNIDIDNLLNDLQ